MFCGPHNAWRNGSQTRLGFDLGYLFFYFSISYSTRAVGVVVSRFEERKLKRLVRFSIFG